MSSKRKYPRVSCQILTYLQDLDVKKKSVKEIFIQDISEGGLRFRTSQLVPLNHRLVFTIEIPKRKPIEVMAKQIWARPCQGVEQYTVGVAFIDLGYAERLVIQSFVNGVLDFKTDFQKTLM